MDNFKIDNYTKSVLTVIAICLTSLTLKQFNLFPMAHAGEPSDNALVPSTNYGLVPLNEDGTITVRLNSNEDLNVNIVGINTTDDINVNIDEIGGGYVSRGGPISVEVEQ